MFPVPVEQSFIKTDRRRRHRRSHAMIPGCGPLPWHGCCYCWYYCSFCTERDISHVPWQLTTSSPALTHCTSSPRSAVCSSCHSNELSSSNCSIPVVISFSAAFRLQFFMTLFIQLLLPARISDTLSLATAKESPTHFRLFPSLCPTQYLISDSLYTV